MIYPSIIKDYAASQQLSFIYTAVEHSEMGLSKNSLSRKYLLSTFHLVNAIN